MSWPCGCCVKGGFSGSEDGAVEQREAFWTGMMGNGWSQIAASGDSLPTGDTPEYREYRQDLRGHSNPAAPRRASGFPHIGQVSEEGRTGLLAARSHAGSFLPGGFKARTPGKSVRAFLRPCAPFMLQVPVRAGGLPGVRFGNARSAEGIA